MQLRAGILSDTHLSCPGEHFLKQVRHCFAACDLIIHAGDLTSLQVLDAFAGKKVYAVHGNMCDTAAYQALPETAIFSLGKFRVGLTHGAQFGRHDIESRLWDLFPEADCMIYGHTHRPACHRQGKVLIVNPGSFQGTGKYGAPGTYAILEVGDELTCTIKEVPRLP